MKAAKSAMDAVGEAALKFRFDSRILFLEFESDLSYILFCSCGVRAVGLN